MSGNNKTESPLVSVIMPAFNHENYVQVAIQSIIDQTYQNIELLILNDGSTDATWSKIQEMRAECENRFSKVVFETQENKGTCLTFNRLLDLCSKKSKSIYLIASDDIALPSAIEKELSFLEENPKYGLCVGDNAFMDSEGKTCYWGENNTIVYDENKATSFTFGQALQTVRGFDFSSEIFGSYEQLYKINHIPNGYLIRHKIINNFRFTPDAPLEDWNLMMHIAKYSKMKYLDDILFKYRWHQSNTAKNIEKMETMEKKTHEYENEILNKIDFCRLLPENRKFVISILSINGKHKFLSLLLKEYHFMKRILHKLVTAKTILKDYGFKGFMHAVFIKIRYIKSKHRIYGNRRMKHAWKTRHDFYLNPFAFGVKKSVFDAQRTTSFSKNIKFSILVPLYNTPKDFLHEMIGSVLFQTYENWELCLADGSDSEHDYVKEICQEISGNEPRIKYRKLEKNEGISANTNKCLEMANGDYICLFDHDDLLHPSALFESMKAICEKDADFVYTDEATFESPKLHNIIYTNFKPDFSPDYFHSINYICHFSSFKKTLLDETGCFDSKTDGAQDFDLFLRLSEKTDKIVHIAKCLYYWRASSTSTAGSADAKSYTTDAGKFAVEEHLKRCKIDASVEKGKVPNSFKINYKIKGPPLISILIPNYEHWQTLKKCIDSILNLSTYHNYEIIIIENNSKQKETFDYYDSLKSNEKIKIVTWEGEFNYSAINNFGFKYANGEYILLLNNDIEVITPNWLEEMLMYAQRKDVGAVGALLYYPSDKIQHAGVIVGLGGIAGHLYGTYPKTISGYNSRYETVQNFSAVTFACCMIPKSVYEEVNGLDEKFKVAFNDVDMCLRIRYAGYLVVWTPYAELYHYESESRGYEDTPEKIERFKGEILRMQECHKEILESGDPYYNLNLSLTSGDFTVVGEVFPSETQK